MNGRKPSPKRVLKAYSWPVEQIGVEATEPIEYQPEDKRIFAPVEDGQQNGNFSGQVFRELYDRQTDGDLGSTPNLRERPPRDGVGLNFETPNDKQHKIGSVDKVAAKTMLETLQSMHFDVKKMHNAFKKTLRERDEFYRENGADKAIKLDRKFTDCTKWLDYRETVLDVIIRKFKRDPLDPMALDMVGKVVEDHAKKMKECRIVFTDYYDDIPAGAFDLGRRASIHVSILKGARGKNSSARRVATIKRVAARFLGGE